MTILKKLLFWASLAFVLAFLVMVILRIIVFWLIVTAVILIVVGYFLPHTEKSP